MADEQKEVPQVNVSQKDLVPYIIKQGEALAKQVNEARKKYGDRYNKRNSIEMMYSKVGNPLYRHGAERFASEFFLILQKKSTLPATVRYPVRDICNAAMNECYHDKLQKLYEQQQREKEKEGNI